MFRFSSRVFSEPASRPALSALVSDVQIFETRFNESKVTHGYNNDVEVLRHWLVNTVIYKALRKSTFSTQNHTKTAERPGAPV